MGMEVSMKKLNITLITILLVSTFVVTNTFAQNQPRTIIEMARWTGYDMSIHPDGKTVAAAAIDKFVRIYDMETAVEIQVLEGHGKGVESVRYNPKGDILVSGDQDGFNYIWNTDTNAHIKTLDRHAWAIQAIAFTLNGKILATGDWGWGNTLRLWNTETWELLHGMDSGKVDAAAFSLDGSMVASGSLDTGLVHIWDTDSGELLQKLDTGMENVMAVEFWGKERMIVVGGSGGLQLWDAEAGDLVNTFKKIGDDNSVRTLAINPDRRLMASGRNDGLVHLWDLNTLKLLETIDWHFGRLNAVAFTPDGFTLATTANEIRMGIWDVEPLEDIVLNVNPRDKVSVLWGDLKQR